VVAEMLRWLIHVWAEMWRAFWHAVETGSFGNPIGQRRAVDRMRKAAGRFPLQCHLEPAKRCRFQITLVEIVLCDPATCDAIDEAPAVVPAKPWLSIVATSVTGQGPHRPPEVKHGVLLLISHHALSGLTQRCGARDAADLVLAAEGLFDAFLTVENFDPTTIPDGYRLPFVLAHRETAGIAVLSPYERHRGYTALVTTILDPDMT
jgi:hypothetical protein